MSKYLNNREFYYIDAIDFEYYMKQGGIPGTYDKWLKDELQPTVDIDIGVRQRMVNYTKQHKE